MRERSVEDKSELTIEWIQSSEPSLRFSASAQPTGGCCFPLFKKRKESARIKELKDIIDKINNELTLATHRRDSDQVAYFTYQIASHHFTITGFHNSNGAPRSLNKEKHPKLLLEQEQFKTWLTTGEREVIDKMSASLIKKSVR